MKKNICPRCKLPYEGINECEYCGLVFEKPELKIRIKKSQYKDGSKKLYIIILISIMFLGASFGSYKYIVSPYFAKRAMEYRKQEVLKADQIDKLKYENAYKALIKIEALCESGVNYLEYSKAVANAWAEIKLLDQSSIRANILKACIFHYQQGKEIWTAKFDDFLPSIEIRHLASQVKGFDMNGETNGLILFDRVLKFVWIKASITLKEYENYKPI